MIIDLALKATAVLLIGAAGVTLLPKAAAAVRHIVCTLTVLAVLLLPLRVAHPILPWRFTFRVSAGVLPLPAGPSHFPLMAIWLAGVFLVMARFAMGVAYLNWKTRRAQGGGPIRFASVDSPLVWGRFRPVILMPLAAAQWTRERWALAIAHEQAHIDRLDIWTSTLGVLAEAIYWFHPLMWWLTHRMREEQELACDQKVLEQGSDGIAYAELLVETAGLPESALFGCRMTGGTMKKRLERILHWQKASAWSGAKKGIAIIACSLCLATGALLAPGATDNGPYKIGGDVMPPKLVEKREPQYTKKARKAKIQGTVLLDLVISAEGKPDEINVIKSLDPGLDKKAIEAVASWRFEPAQKDGKAVAVKANVEVNFRLL